MDLGFTWKSALQELVDESGLITTPTLSVTTLIKLTTQGVRSAVVAADRGSEWNSARQELVDERGTVTTPPTFDLPILNSV